MNVCGDMGVITWDMRIFSYFASHRDVIDYIFVAISSGLISVTVIKALSYNQDRRNESCILLLSAV